MNDVHDNNETIDAAFANDLIDPAASGTIITICYFDIHLY